MVSKDSNICSPMPSGIRAFYQPVLSAVDNARIKESIEKCSQLIWSTPSLCLKQLDVLSMLQNPDAPDAVLAALRTGYRKNHIMRVLGTIEMGFTLTFIPLLTLSTDVLHKFQLSDQRYG